VSSFGEGGGGPCRSRGHRERSFGKHRAQLVLACEESAYGFAVDAASQPGDDGACRSRREQALVGSQARLALLSLLPRWA